MSRRPYLQLCLLGLAHGLNDAVSAFIIYSNSNINFFSKISIFIIYSIVAFALQPIAGIISDKFLSEKKSTLMGASMVFFGSILSLFYIYPGLAIIAIGSSFFHVGAGSWAIRLTPGQSFGPGIYTAPGVLGLALGILYGLVYNQTFLFICVALLLAVLLCIYLNKNSNSVKPARIEKHNNKMALITLGILVVAVAIRSFVWNSYQGGLYGSNLVLILAIAAFFGKLIGGFIADKMRWREFIILISSFASLGIFFSSYMPLLIIGVGFLQSSTPFILMLIGRIFNKNLAFAVGCILGLAIAIGGLLYFLFANIGVLGKEVSILISMALLLVSSRFIKLITKES